MSPSGPGRVANSAIPSILPNNHPIRRIQKRKDGMTSSSSDSAASLGLCLIFLFLFLMFLGALSIRSKMLSARRKSDQLVPATPEDGLTTKLLHAKVYEIRVPKGLDWDPDKATNFVRHLIGIFPSRSMILRIVAESGRVAWQIVDYGPGNQDTQLVIQGVRSMYPQAEVTVSDYRPLDFAHRLQRSVIPFKLGAEFRCPLKTVQEMKKNDPLAALVHAMSANLQEGEQFIYTVFVAKLTDNKLIQAGLDQIHQLNVHPLQFLSADGWVDLGER